MVNNNEEETSPYEVLEELAAAGIDPAKLLRDIKTEFEKTNQKVAGTQGISARDLMARDTVNLQTTYNNLPDLKDVFQREKKAKEQASAGHKEQAAAAGPGVSAEDLIAEDQNK